MSDLNQDVIERFLKDLMEVERRYANELRNTRTNRQNDVKEAVEKFCSREFDRENY
jgi:hypothetical protein